MSEQVLITGGAGFIGSHLADELLACGHRVRVLDALIPQVHGPAARRPVYLDEAVELQHGDVRDPDAVRRALEGIDSVVHLAAAVGVGQSMYELAHYTGVNDVGTAVLLEALIERPVRKLVVASSMSIYGEGRYQDSLERTVDHARRNRAQLEDGVWDCLDERGQPLRPVPTPEDKSLALSSVYALSKFDQERLCLMIGEAYGIPTVALRFFNVYGPRQALSNPYTGVLAIFAARYLNGRPPLIFEDGAQQRDFVHVGDVTRACRLALEGPARDVALNIGSGQPRTVLAVAEAVGAALGLDHIEPAITGEYRMGDIRHCFGDIGAARRLLDFQPQTDFTAGIQELATWLHDQQAEDHSEAAHGELRRHGLKIARQATSA